MQRSGRVWRGAVTVLAMVSWLALSNHCALGLATGDPHPGIGAPQHDCCASDVANQPKPAKKSTNPCCKTLQAVSISLAAKAFLGPKDQLLTKPIALPALLAFDRAEPNKLTARFLDIGPPDKTTFAETVLQRSLPAHAPPAVS